MAKYSAGDQKPPKLTCENIMMAVEGVSWDDIGFWLLIPAFKRDEISNLYSADSKRCQALIQYWLGLDPSPTWRRVITAVDRMGSKEQQRADRIRSYAEPLTDPTLTLHNFTTAITTVEEWGTLCAVLGVPRAKGDQVYRSYSTLQDKKQAVVLWWLNCAPGSSWAHLAHCLYRREKNAALQQSLKYLKRPTDATLTLSSLSSALEAVHDWHRLGVWLGVPQSRLDQLSQQSPDYVSGKRKMLHEWLTSHPAPSWDIITEALYQGGNLYPRWHSILMEVKKLYGKGRRLFDQAMKDGFVESLSIKVIYFGTAGAGKTCSKAVLLGLPPPINRASTAMAERPVRAICVDMKEGGEWVIMGPKEVKESLATAIRATTGVRHAAEAKQESSQHVSQSTTTTTSPSTSSSVEQQSTASRSTQDPSLSSRTTTAEEEVTQSALLHEASDTEEELVKLIDQVVVPVKVARFKWVYFLDTGGQPQFHEMFRAFLKRASFCIFVQKLSERLDEYPLVEYYDESSRLVGEPYRAALTHQQILNVCVRTMQSHNPENKPPKIIMLGTHADKEYQCSETREAKNQKLMEVLVPAFPKQVVYYGQSMKDLIFPLNARCPGEAEKVVAQEIREVILKECPHVPDNIPLRWYALEQALQELALKYGRDVLKKEECFGAALRLHFDEDSFEAALQYLHDLNIIFYYHEILRELVFCNPQVLLDKLTELVKHSHQLKKNPDANVACSGMWSEFKSSGLVTVEMLSSFDKHYVPGIFGPAELIKLFRKLLMFADMKESEYFVPSLLEILNPSQVIDYRSSCTASDRAPLVVYFPDGLRLGVACSLVVFLLSKDNCYPTAWKLHTNKSTRSPTCLFRNCIKFTVPGFPGSITLFDSISLFDSFDFFEVHVSAPTRFLHEMCPLVYKSIFTGLERTSEVLSYSDLKPLPAFICGCGQGSRHPATVGAQHNCLICSRDEETCEEFKKEHSLWFESKTVSTKSSAHERVALRRYEIIRFLAANVSPGALADKLLAVGLISESIREKALVTELAVSETIRPMIDAVITRIELNATKYDLFISVLRQFGSLEDLIQYIEMLF